MKKFYTIQEIDYLMLNYQENSKENILLNISRSWSSIQKKVHSLGIKRIIYESKNNNKYIKLSLDIPETYYWIGLLMADGHFQKRGVITLSIHINDLEHTNRFRDYIGIKKSSKQLISISDKLTFNKLSDKFKINNQKTYDPCDLSKITDEDLLFSLIVGFIDGDGNISKNGIKIVSHKNWYNNFEIFNKVLMGNIYMTKKNLIILNIGKSKLLFDIKERANRLNLPLMERKWSKIDLSKIYKQNKGTYCSELFKKGLSIKEVVNLGIVGESCAYKYYSIHKGGNIKEFNKKDYCFNLFKKGLTVKEIVLLGKVNYLCAYRNYKKFIL